MNVNVKKSSKNVSQVVSDTKQISTNSRNVENGDNKLNSKNNSCDINFVNKIEGEEGKINDIIIISTKKQ